MSGIGKGGRPYTVPIRNPGMTCVIACLRRIGVDCADVLVPDARSDTRSVSLLAPENTVLSILLISPGRARATSFVDVFIEFMNQLDGLRTFRPDFEPLLFEHATQRSALW